MDPEGLAALDPGSFPPGAATGNTIRRTAVVHRIPIGRRRTVLAALHVEIRWRAVRQGRDSRSAGRAAICRAPAAAVAWAAAITVSAVVATESAAQGREAERTG